MNRRHRFSGQLTGVLLALLFASPMVGQVPKSTIGSVDESKYHNPELLRELIDKAETSDPRAQTDLADHYRHGLITPADSSRAAYWYRRAAEQGYANAMEELGRLLLHGQGVPRDPTEALRWFRRESELGYTRGMESIGEMYRKGDGVLQDFVESYGWLTVAAAGGNTSASDLRDSLGAKMSPDQVAAAQIRAKVIWRDLNPKPAKAKRSGKK